MKNKKDMVESGKIEDLRIFKLMYLEKCINEAKLLSELKKRAFNDQIEHLKLERQSVARSFELRQRTLSDEVAQIREQFEIEYNIQLKEWGYDDSTGVLVVLDPATLNALHSKETIQKGVAAKKSDDKKKRTSRVKKNNVPQVEEPIIKGTNRKPPAGVAEA